LRDGALDARVDRGEDERVTAAVGEPPDPDAERIDVLPRLEVADRVPVVLDLHGGIDVLAPRAVARTEVPIVEQQDREPGVDEEPRVVRLYELFHVAPATRHHDRGMRSLALFRREEPAADGLARADEFDILPQCDRDARYAAMPARRSSSL
jgi:hypothetical protein